MRVCDLGMYAWCRMWLLPCSGTRERPGYLFGLGWKKVEWFGFGLVMDEGKIGMDWNRLFFFAIRNSCQLID